MTLGKQSSEPGQRFLQESSLCVLLMKRSPAYRGHLVAVNTPRAHRLDGKIQFSTKTIRRVDPNSVYVIDTHYVCLPFRLLSNKRNFDLIALQN